MSQRPDLWSAAEPAHLPQYGHTAIVIGSVLIVAITVLVSVAALAVLVVSGGGHDSWASPSQRTAARWWSR
jgi:hypothetical protein